MALRSARTNARTRARTTAWTVLPLLAVTLVCGCSADSDDPPPATSSTTTATTPTTTEPAATNGATAAPPASFAPGEQCAAAQLTLAFGAAAESASSQHDVPLVFTNASGVECTLTGYPGTMLRSSEGAGYDLPRSTRVPTDRVVVRPGGMAQAMLTYLSAEPGDDTAFVPATVVVTPPDQFDQIVATWPFGPVLDQSGATHPGTYISAISSLP